MDNNKTLIVGGGPAGLATALMLAKRGWRDITVLERRSSASSYQVDKSYSYLIDGRGQKIIDLLGITDNLAGISVPTTEFYLTEIKTDGSLKKSKLPIVDPNRKTAYWLPRSEFLNLLYEEIKQNWQEQITVLFNTQCLEIISIENKLEIVAKDDRDNILKFAPNFLVGCDGINSIVRQTLAKWEDSEGDLFTMKEFSSPSAGLKYKTLILPAKFPLNSDRTDFSNSTMAYAIRGLKTNNTVPYSLGLLPVKNPDLPRNANIIRREEDPIWKLKTGQELLEFLTEIFPQIPIKEIISPEEAARFVNSKGGYFPKPQYCLGSYFLPKNNYKIALLGDAIHCFPPDIGQGVNSALEDIIVLKEALDSSKDDLTAALPLYQSRRNPDTKALIALARFAYPYQYNQDPIAKKLWSINFTIRLLLSKILPFLIAPPAFLMIQNEQLSYKQILNKTAKTTVILSLILGAGCLSLLKIVIN